MSMQPVVATGVGFLLAVLWMDLMFDVQAFRLVQGVPGEVSEPVLASIGSYYRRVTTDSRPMSRLIAAVMLAMLLAIVVQAVQNDAPRWVSAVSAISAVVSIGLAAARTVPSAIRLGARQDPVATQFRLCRSVLRDHLLCFALVSLLLVTQLAWG